ncbi:MAG TPA: GNAT family N-acetyltransferase [Luteolibacter sp.]|nr:GNAT family N-acetyltransferase [Luteolibacter sp.]
MNLYESTFRDPSEREDPEEWRRRLMGEEPSPQPRTRLIIAVRGDSTDGGEMLGGLVFEHYRESRCGLLTYLVVAPDQRCQGIARLLLGRATRSLEEEAAAHGGLQAVFAEAADPALVGPEHDGMSSDRRLRALYRLGLRHVRLNYVQPELSGGKGRSRHLMLLALLPPVMSSVPGKVVKEFLHEFYRALGVPEPDQDPDFKDMAMSLSDGVSLCRTKREKPTLTLPRASVCLHFVEEIGTVSNLGQSCEPPDCPVISSMELDLLSYRYQTDRPFFTRCESNGRIPLTIVFPAEFTYQSEGRTTTLTCPSPIRRAEACLNSTTFPLSGLRIWHLVLTPSQNEDMPAEERAFNEYDIIKLIHLYDGRSEHTGLLDKIGFEGIGSAPGGPPSERGTVDVHELLAELKRRGSLSQDNGTFPGKGDSLHLTAGTVQIEVGWNISENATLASLFEAVCEARQPDGEAEVAKLKDWLKAGGREAAMLMACCGIVTGIFDFEEIDEEEVLDTLEPTFADAGTLLRIHRCTLVSMTESDRALRECWSRVGISPYLIIPHALLLHNEKVVDLANSATDSGLRSLRLAEMEGGARRASECLDRLHLPNVFNYVTERTLYERGNAGRGSMEKFTATRLRLQELQAQIELAWQHRRDRGQMFIAIILIPLSLIQLKTPIAEFWHHHAPPALINFNVWVLMTLIWFGISVLMIWLTRMGNRQLR